MSSADTTNTACWTPAWLEQVTQGKWLESPQDKHAKLIGIGIDSRTIKPGQVFLAIQGENFDGHNFLSAAFKQGAAVAIIDHENAIDPSNHQPVLLVDDTITALQDLARDYRDRLRDAGCTVIAVVGSNGKTTTRNLIHAVLASTYQGTQSPKSFNNHIGVPLTLLGASLADRYLVAEVGTNHPGEIHTLGELLKPDAAVITSIGHEHMAFFGSLAGVAKEEASITQHLPDDGTLFVEHDAFTYISEAPTYKPTRHPTLFGQGAEAARRNRQLLGDRQRFAISDGTSIDLPLLAAHDVGNALAAVSVGRWLGVDDPAIKSALERVQPMPGRLVIKHFGEVTVIDDTYNANPDSVMAALDVLTDMPTPDSARRVAVLGDMLELGDLSMDAHTQVGQRLVHMAQAGSLQHADLVGPLMAQAHAVIKASHPGLPVTHHADCNEPALDSIANSIKAGDIVLCKASRGLQLERLVDKIQSRFSGQT